MFSAVLQQLYRIYTACNLGMEAVPLTPLVPTSGITRTVIKLWAVSNPVDHDYLVISIMCLAVRIFFAIRLCADILSEIHS